MYLENHYLYCQRFFLKNLTGTYPINRFFSLKILIELIFCASTILGIGKRQNKGIFFMKLDLYYTCHFNLTDHFQNWSLQMTLKITWSYLPKLKWQLLKIKLCSKLASFVSRLSRPLYFSCFDLLSFWTWLQLLQIEKIATWKMESPPQSWKFSMVISQHVKYQYLNTII